MGFEKKYRPEVTKAAESLGSTSGLIGSWPPVTIVTATATGLVYQLPVPKSGFQKTVIVDWTGDTGNVTIANKSTATVFNGSTSNVITVSSSQRHANIILTGISSAQWSANITGNLTTGSQPIQFAASTVTS